MQAVNLDLENVFTPVDPLALNQLLLETDYDNKSRIDLVKGFTTGFRLEYEGSRTVQLESDNLKLTVGTKTDIWNKIMKEVKNKRYAGPFKRVPFKNYIQSPIGLVPKDGGKDTRLIFHLSHPRKKETEKQLSVNANTDKAKASVQYPDFSEAIRRCLEEGKGCYAGKSDFKSAFRHLPICKLDWCFLVMKAESPIDGKFYYFVDKCLPFGASISCAHFQKFSNAVAHIFKIKTGKVAINYLDDFFFVALYKQWCNIQIKNFLDICEKIKFPVSMEKTEYATNQITFLGILIDTCLGKVFIPIEKIHKAKWLIKKMIIKKKARIDEIQRLCGLLNFFSKCIIPARTFTRRIYAKLSGYNLLPHHHVDLDSEIRLDLGIWEFFLNHASAYSRTWADFDVTLTAKEIDMYSSGSIGCGGYCGKEWFSLEWNEQFLQENPSIEYLELYAVTVAIVNWIKNFRDQCIMLHCDNQSAVDMINSTVSSCKNCMVLLRIIMLQGLIYNVKIVAKHVKGKDNTISDYLSRGKFRELKENKKFATFKEDPTPIPKELWPMEKLWVQ